MKQNIKNYIFIYYFFVVVQDVLNEGSSLLSLVRDRNESEGLRRHFNRQPGSWEFIGYGAFLGSEPRVVRVRIFGSSFTSKQTRKYAELSLLECNYFKTQAMKNLKRQYELQCRRKELSILSFLQIKRQVHSW